MRTSRFGPFLCAAALACVAGAAHAQEGARGGVFSPNESTGFVSPNGAMTVDLLLNQDNTPETPAAVSVISMRAGATVPEHLHEGSTEILYIMEGRGTLTVGPDVLELVPGSVAYIPENTLHSYVNSPEERTVAVQVYVAPGPEQRFRGWEPAFELPTDTRDQPDAPATPQPETGNE